MTEGKKDTPPPVVTEKKLPADDETDFGTFDKTADTLGAARGGKRGTVPEGWEVGPDGQLRKKAP